MYKYIVNPKIQTETSKSILLYCHSKFHSIQTLHIEIENSFENKKKPFTQTFGSPQTTF